MDNEFSSLPTVVDNTAKNDRIATTMRSNYAFMNDIARDDFEHDLMKAKGFHKLDRDKILEALTRIAAGETARSIADDMGLSRSIFAELGRRHSEFAEHLENARFDGFVAKSEIAEEILLGKRTTGSVARDRAYAEYVLKLAKTMLPHRFAERIEVDTRQYVINVLSQHGDEF